MNSLTLPTAVQFGGQSYPLIDRDGVPHLAARDLARALQYADESGVLKIFQRNASEFTAAMTCTVKLTAQGDLRGQARETRLFSLRGCHLVAMFAQTHIAAAFRRWVLDVLEGIEQQPRPPMPAPTPTVPADQLTAAQAELMDTQRKLIATQERLLAVTDKVKPKPSKKQRPITEEEIAEMRRLRATGLGCTEIGRRVGRHGGTVSMLIRDVKVQADLFGGAA